MNYSRLYKTLALTAFTVSLAACGGGGSDSKKNYSDGKDTETNCSTHVSSGGTIINTDCGKSGDDSANEPQKGVAATADGNPISPPKDTVKPPTPAPAPPEIIPSGYGGQCEPNKPWHPEPEPYACDYPIESYPAVEPATPAPTPPEVITSEYPGQCEPNKPWYPEPEPYACDYPIESYPKH